MTATATLARSAHPHASPSPTAVDQGPQGLPMVVLDHITLQLERIVSTLGFILVVVAEDLKEEGDTGFDRDDPHNRRLVVNILGSLNLVHDTLDSLTDYAYFRTDNLGAPECYPWTGRLYDAQALLHTVVHHASLEGAAGDSLRISKSHISVVIDHVKSVLDAVRTEVAASPINWGKATPQKPQERSSMDLDSPTSRPALDVADVGDSCESGATAFGDLIAKIAARNPVDAATMRNPLHADLATAFRSTLQRSPAHVEGFFRELGAILNSVADGCSIEGYAKGVDFADPVQAKQQQDIDDRWTKLEEAGVPFDTTLALPAWALSLATSRPASKTSQALSPAAGRETTDDTLPWNELPRDKARADLTACIESSPSAVTAGARLAQSMLRAMEPVQGGESTGPADEDFAPWAYDAMGLEIQRYMGAAALDAQSAEVMRGFAMALAVYLHAPCFTGSVWALDMVNWDPVEELQDAGFCKLEPPAPRVKRSRTAGPQLA